MKKWVALFFVCIYANSFSQTNISPQFSELKGMEDEQSRTHLFYRIYSFQPGGQIGDYFENSIYHFDLVNAVDTLFLFEGGRIGDSFVRIVDVEFWNSSPANFIYLGESISTDPVPFIQRYDTPDPTYTGLGEAFGLELGKFNTDLIIASAPYLIKSTDAGYNWAPFLDSLFLKILSITPYDDNEMFFGGNGSDLEKTIDGGVTISLVDTNHLGKQFYYDPDLTHIYSLGNNELIVSDDKGNAFSWVYKYSSTDQIFLSLDYSKSGNIFLSDGKNIFISTNYGDNFSLYKTLDKKITGIYKKASAGCALSKLYAATKYKIYEITSDTIQVIKSLPIPEDAFDWFPLNLGDMWVSYHEEINNVGDTSKYFLRREVIGYKEFENKIYTKVLVKLNSLDNTNFREDNYSYYRVDSLNGFIYRSQFQNDSTLWFESFLMDLIAEVGDTIPFSFGTVLESEEPIIQFGVSSSKRTFRVIPSFGQQFELVKGFGLVYDTVWTSINYVGRLVGCKINGIVYGDTTTVGVEDEKNPIATSFKLEQNYPNPFNPSTKIRWQSPVGGWQTIKVYDVLGNEVATLVNEEKPAGEYEVGFDASAGIRNLVTGIYFYQLKAGEFIQTKKMVYLK